MEGALITAVDSSVLLDVLTNSPAFAGPSLRALRESRDEGAVIACPVVWAEVSANFPDLQVMRSAFALAGIRFDSFNETCAELAGAMWREYRRQGGQRTHLVGDFLVAAHAQLRANRLLTRDRGFARRYFHSLVILEPRS